MRTAAAYLLLTAATAAVIWAVSFGRMPPAEFTFCNGDDIKTVDPAQATGQPEGRIIWALFEGLTRWHPETLEPLPGAAQRWDVSDDRRTYTFHIRPDARWSDGSPVTADDFEYSMRRFLHPTTAAEYAKELWYIVGAKRYTTSEVAPGDPVEVERHQRPPGTLPHARGVVLRGRLVAKGAAAPPAAPTGRHEGAPCPALSQAEREQPGQQAGRPVYTVAVGGRLRHFQPGRADEDVAPGCEPCRVVTYDFRRVGIRAFDRRTLQIRLRYPVPYFLSLMGFYPFSPVNRRCVETYGYPAWTRPENIVGNGAFRLKFRRVRDRIRLVRSDTYWNRDAVKLETVDALAVKSATTMLNLYLTGQADWIPTVPPEVVGQLLDRDPGDFRPAPYLAIYYYLLNTGKPPLDDVRVRRALALAVDRQQITEELLRCGQTPAYSMVPPHIGRYVPYEPATLLGEPNDAAGGKNPGQTPPPDGRIPSPESRLRRARQLLAEAGYPRGRGAPPMDILYNTSETHRAVAELIQSQWKRNLGLDVGLSNQEWGAYLAARREGRFQLARAGWIGDYVSPRTFLDLFSSDNPQNHSGWSDPQYDRLLRRAQYERDIDRRMRLYHRAEEILMQRLPVIPLYVYVSQSMVRPYIKGFFPNIQDVHPLWAVSVDQEGKRRLLGQDP
ncbi:MAG: peptide ABC transporter substrate-binding protein [Pirellulales bacterium]